MMNGEAAAVAQLIDTKSLGKPDKFNGDESAWPTWSFVLLSWLEFVSSELVAAMMLAGEQTESIDIDLMSDVNQRLSRQLYAMLTFFNSIKLGNFFYDILLQ